ncbi:MAG: hypothetical protein IJ137_03195 [Eubacterium sp.]|nr:hypothetical protein [Eubacterium sp.]
MKLLEKKVLLSVLGGFVLGKTGDFIFGGDTAKKVYVKAASLGMILKDCTMEKVEAIQAGASDIAAEAREEADKYQAKKDAAFEALLEDDTEEINSYDTEADTIEE